MHNKIASHASCYERPLRMQVAMVNSSWTAGHIAQLWWRWQPPTIVYPPCDTKSLQVSLPTSLSRLCSRCPLTACRRQDPTPAIWSGKTIPMHPEQQAVGLLKVPIACSLPVQRPATEHARGFACHLIAAGPAFGQEAEASVPGVCGPVPAREGPRSAAARLCLRQAGSCWAVLPLR